MKMLITLFFCIISIFTVSASGQVEFHQGEDGYTWFEKKGITMKWKIESESLNVILSAATEGWVAVGFIQGLVKEKEGADLIIAYVDGGKTFIRDDFAYSAFDHSSDIDLGGTDNITLISGSEKDGITTVNFTKPMVSPDQYDYNPVIGTEFILMLAFSNTDDFTSEHKEAFMQKVVF